MNTAVTADLVAEASGQLDHGVEGRCGACRCHSVQLPAMRFVRRAGAIWFSGAMWFFVEAAPRGRPSSSRRSYVGGYGDGPSC